MECIDDGLTAGDQRLAAITEVEHPAQRLLWRFDIFAPRRVIDDVLEAVGQRNRFDDGERGAPASEHDREVHGCIVMPGMIDFHTHVYWGGTSISIDADALAQRSGTTTWLDVGSADPGNFIGFRKHVIEPSQTRILAYLHVSHAGIFAFSPTVMVGGSQDLRLMDTERCAQVALEHPDLIRGVKVRIQPRERIGATISYHRGR